MILGGIFSGVFTPTESAAVAAVVAIGLALFWYGSMSPAQLPGALTLAALEAGIVMLLLGDSQILAKALFLDGFGTSLTEFMTGITTDKYVFLLVVNLLLLAVGIFIEPLPALYILAPYLAPLAVGVYGIDPVHFGLIMVFNLVLALIHPPIGLVLFLISSVAKVPIERLSITIIPWLAVSPGGAVPGDLPAQRRGAGHLAPGRLNRAHLLAAAAMLCWGSAYVPSAWLVDHLPPLTSAAARLGLAGLLLLGLLAARGRSLHPGVGWRTILWLGLTQTAIFYGTTYWGIEHEEGGPGGRPGEHRPPVRRGTVGADAG